MNMQPASLESIEVDALQTDRYLDALLSAVERRGSDAPADAAVDPALRRAARRLRDELVRTHPSFRFEERLARRLADAAARMRLATAAGGEAEAALIPFPAPMLADPTLAAELMNPELAALLGAQFADRVSGETAPGLATTNASGTESLDVTSHPARPAGPGPLLIRGALTSAALSLAGAAFVAWRMTREAPTDPMARAVRAGRAAREAATATAMRATAGRPFLALHATTVRTAADARLRRRRLA